MNIINVYLGLFISRKCILNILSQDDVLGLENIENSQLMTNFEQKWSFHVFLQTTTLS